MKHIFLLLLTLALTFAAFSQNTTTAKPAPAPQPTAQPSPPAVEDDGEVVKISTNLIQIDVTVLDKDGKQVTDLRPEEIEIYENNEKQTITNFSYINNASGTANPAAVVKTDRKDPTSPGLLPVKLRPDQVRRTIALVVDDLGLSFESIHYVKRALKKFVDEQMQPGDLVAIIRTAGGMGALQQFTSDKRQLYAAIEKVRWYPAGRGGVGAFAPAVQQFVRDQRGQQSEARALSDTNTDIEAERVRQDTFAVGTMGAVQYIVKGMADLPGRKSVMVFSDGFVLFNINGDNARIRDAMRSLTDAANRAAVIVHTTDARGLAITGVNAVDDVTGLSSRQIQDINQERNQELLDTQFGLAVLARDTGGAFTKNSNDLNDGVEKMLEEQKGYYLVGYAPDDETFDPVKRRYNRLTVRVSRPGVRVRYRSGFFGIQDEKVKPTAPTAQQKMLEALTSPFAKNDVRVSLNAFFGNAPKEGSFARLLLHIDINDLTIETGPDSKPKTEFDIVAIAFGENGTVIDQINKHFKMSFNEGGVEKTKKSGVVYSVSFPLKKPGAYQIRTVMVDTATKKIGSANQYVEVPNLKKGSVALSGILMENYTISQWQKISAGAKLEGDPADLPDHFTDTAVRRFKRGTILRFGASVYNAQTDSVSQKPNLSGVVRLYKDGALIFEGTKAEFVTSAEGINFQNIIMLGTEMLPGDYVLQVIVNDNLAKEKKRTAIQVVDFQLTD
jgi:VWFA-related protein